MISIIYSLVLMAFHPVHVSVAEIEHDKNSKALEITVRIFLDDIEKYFQSKHNNNELDITEDTFELDHALELYLGKNFEVALSGKQKSMAYLGHEIEGNVIFTYLEIKSVRKVKSIEVHNSLLFETFSDQTNLVHVDLGGDIQSLKLVPGEPKGRLTFTED